MVACFHSISHYSDLIFGVLVMLCFFMHGCNKYKEQGLIFIALAGIFTMDCVHVYNQRVV